MNNLKLERIYTNNDYTISKLYFNDKYLCDTLEDTVRQLPKECPYTSSYNDCHCKEKVVNRTAIPSGTYKVIYNYSNRFKRNMLRLVDVPHFLGVLIHSGNTNQNTSGCILVGINSIKGQLTESVSTLNKLLNLINFNKPIQIEIINLF